MTPQRALITGGNNGIGYETALALATTGTEVVLAGRDEAKLHTAAAKIREQLPTAQVDTLHLDLADLASVKTAAQALLATGRPLDLLINNAGVMAVPDRRLTADGFELTFGTNHLGHFALTGHLLPALTAAKTARVITVSAKVSRTKNATLDDPLSENSYSGMAAYTKSKLANVVFTVELARRTRNVLTAVAVHPGTSATGLQQHTPKVLQALTSVLLDRLVGQSPSEAARPSLYAATVPGVKSGSFIVPKGRAELRGEPGEAELPPAATNPATGQRLWKLSESLTNVHY
ncbi:oxidoreductase [Umezawaea sp. NPDC059074]|uniref:oxidoreductase n=1 Tax=Umezawaea sp. NPDC059074 TaxID=3346716 RepID=UPI0036992D9C